MIIWNKNSGGYEPNHKKALENQEFDKAELNEGWTYFGHEEAEIKGCGACLKALEDKVKQFMQDGKEIDTSFLKSCYKAILPCSKSFI